MKHFTFYRESNKFDDILNDPTLKKHIYIKLQWYQHLTIGCNDLTESIQGYLMLKFGEDLRSLTDKNYTPIANVDYVPKRH